MRKTLWERRYQTFIEVFTLVLNLKFFFNYPSYGSHIPVWRHTSPLKQELPTLKTVTERRVPSSLLGSDLVLVGPGPVVIVTLECPSDTTVPHTPGTLFRGKSVSPNRVEVKVLPIRTQGPLFFPCYTRRTKER